MSTHSVERVITETGITSDVITMKVGPAIIRVYAHGSTNTMRYNGQDVTAQLPLEVQLVQFDGTYKQRGANPYHGPVAGRYPETFAQPGPVDIHGVFAGLAWNIEEISDEGGYIQLGLSAEEWKGAMKNYYYFAARKPEEFSEERASLTRLIEATTRRYKRNKGVQAKLGELRSLLESGQADSSLGQTESLVGDLVDFAYPGEANLVRRITIEELDENATSFLDEVWIENVSPNTNSKDASGYHTYFNTLLREIVVPKGYWGESEAPPHWDNYLPGMQVREMNQTERLGRRIFLIPEGELQDKKAIQIIYKDPKTVGKPIAAVECWRQKGDEKGYPKKARIIKPGEVSHVGIRVIVVEGDVVPEFVQNYIDQANQRLGVLTK